MAKKNEKGRTGQDPFIMRGCYSEARGGKKMVSLPIVPAFIR